MNSPRSNFLLLFCFSNGVCVVTLHVLTLKQKFRETTSVNMEDNDMPSFEMVLTEDTPIEINKEQPRSRNSSSSCQPVLKKKNKEERSCRRKLFSQEEMDDSIEFFEEKVLTPKKVSLQVESPTVHRS